MITAGAKLWLGISALALVAAIVFAVASDFEWFGAFVLGTIAASSFLLGVVAVAIRDGDIEPTLDPAAAEVPARRSLPAIWPPLAAFAAGLAVVGLAGETTLFYGGVGLLGLVFLEWLVQGWAERATGDHETNRNLRNRVMSPFEVPVVAALSVAFIVLTFSRVLLATSKTGSVVVAIVVASVFLLIAALISLRPQLTSSLVTGVVVIGAVALLAAGIAGGVAGERHIEPHHTERADEAEHGTETETETETHETENVETVEGQTP